MTIQVRPEWPTAALRSSQATHAAVDNSAPSPTGPSSTYKSGKVVQTPGASSLIIYPKTKIIGVNLATKFEYCVLAVAVATSLTLIGFVLWCARFGFDLTDEGSFLIWIENPWSYKASATQFGFVYHPIYKVLGGDIVLLRQFNILVTVALTWTMFGCLLRSVLKKCSNLALEPRLPAIGLSLVLSTSAMLFLCARSVTPSYNSLSLQSLLIAGSGILLAEARATRVGIAGYVLIGIAGWMAFMAKPTTAAALGLVVVSYLMAAEKFRVYLLAMALVIAIFLWLLSAWVIDGSVATFLGRLIDGANDVQLIAGGYALPDILGLNGYSFSRMEKLGHLISSSYREIIVFTLAASLLWLASWLSFSERSGARMAGACIGLAVAVMGLAMVTGLYSPPIVWGQFHEILFGVMFFGATLAIFALGCRRLLKRGASKLALAVCFAIFPFVFAFGSNNDYLSVGSRAGTFWIASCILVISAMSLTRQSWRVLLPLGVGAQALAILIFLVAMEYPFRQPQPLWQNEAVVRVGRSGSELVLSHEVAKYIGELDQLLKNGGFLQGDPVIDLTGRSPGVLFVVGARSIGLPWLSGGYKGSTNLAIAALDRESCNELARMWVLTEPTGPRNIQSEILRRYGLDLKGDFTDLGELRSPAGSYLGGYEQHVLKPIRRPEEVRVECERRRTV